MASRVRSGRGSKAKGSDYERELAAHLNENVGLNSRRALLSGGGRNDGGSDLEGTPLIHIEAKRTETFSPYAAMEQAEASISKSGVKTMPVVIQRRNQVKTGKSMVVMRMDDWMQLYSAYLEKKGVSLSREVNSFASLLNGGHDSTESASY